MVDINKVLAFIEERIRWNEEMLERDPKPSDVGRIEEAKCIKRYIERQQEKSHKFQVGDRIKHKHGALGAFKIEQIADMTYIGPKGERVGFACEDDWELVGKDLEK